MVFFYSKLLRWKEYLTTLRNNWCYIDPISIRKNKSVLLTFLMTFSCLLVFFLKLIVIFINNNSLLYLLKMFAIKMLWKFDLLLSVKLINYKSVNIVACKVISPDSMWYGISFINRDSWRYTSPAIYNQTCCSSWSKEAQYTLIR